MGDGGEDGSGEGGEVGGGGDGDDMFAVAVGLCVMSYF